MASNSVRHAVARTTGSTTWTRKDGEEWKIDCLNHGATTTAPNRGKAWTTGSHPQDWCPKCKAIAAGKAAKITGPRLDLPTPTTEGKAAPKTAAKPAATKPTTKAAPRTRKATAAKEGS